MFRELGNKADGAAAVCAIDGVATRGAKSVFCGTGAQGGFIIVGIIEGGVSWGEGDSSVAAAASLVGLMGAAAANAGTTLANFRSM